jgi:hypothetical protein
MELIGTIKLAKGKKAQILVKALEEVGWDKGELLAEFVNKDKEIELVIIHTLDIIDDWTMETTGRELMNKYSEF